MKYSDLPTKFNIPFANSAGPGYVRSVPQASQIGVHDGWASLTDGFPPLNFLPIGAGGVPPFGQDMNGLLSQITSWSRWQNAGGMVEFDSAFSTAVGGYPQGAIVRATTLVGFWYCLVDDNTVNPDTSSNPFQQGWLFFGGMGQPLLSNVVFYVNPSTGSDSYDGSSATHTAGTIGPFATLTKALAVVAQFAPSTFGATINLSANTHNGAASGFPTARWAHCNVTIVGAGIGSTLITSSNPVTFGVYGPNVFSLSGCDVSSTTSTAGGAVVIVSNLAATLSLNNIRYQGNSGSAGSFAGSAGGTMLLGNITINANCSAGGSFFFVAGTGAHLNMSGANITAQAAGAFSASYFVNAANFGFIDVAPAGATFTSTGNLTCLHYTATFLSLIISGDGSPTYFPGNTPGTSGGNAVYA